MAITVTATLSSGQANADAPSIALKVLVLTGATAAGGTSLQVSNKAQGTITPAASNSLLTWAVAYNTGAGAFGGAAASNTFDQNVGPDAFNGAGSGHYTGTVTAGTGVLVGSNDNGTASGAFAAYEVKASGGSTPLIDASSPAAVTLPLNTGQSLATASFTPPAGSVLVALVAGESNNFSGVDTWTISDSSGLTWTLRAQGTTTVAGQQAMVFTATVPGNVSGAATLAGAGSLAAGAALQAGTTLAGAGSITATATVPGSGGGIWGLLGVYLPASVTVTGTATLAAAGSLTAAAVQASGGTLAAAGSLTAAAALRAGTALAGTGSLTAAVTLRAGTALAGTGSLGDTAATGSGGTLSGAGSLAAAAAMAAGTALAGTGSLAAAATQGTAGTALAGAGNLSAGAAQGTTGTALGGAGALTASPPLKLRSARTVTTGAGSATLAVPAQPVAVGDIIFIWAAAGFVALTFTSAPGDSLTAETANSPASGSPAMSTQLFWKIADASDVAKAAAAGSYTITISTTHPFSAAIGVVPVTSTAHPYDPSDTPGSGQSNAASLAVTAAGVTTASNPDLLVWLGADRATAGGVPPAMTVPAGYAAPSGVTQANSSGTGTVNTGVLLATATQFTAGATGSQAGSISASQVTGGLLLAIKAAPVTAIPGTVSQVVAGAPSSSGFGVVAKTSGATSCRLAYSTSSGMTSPSYVAAQTPDSLGYVRFAVTGLAARTRYYVQVTDTPAGGTETLIGPVGQARTLPAAGSPQNFTVAFGSCIAGGDTTTPPATDAAIADWISYDPDLSVFLGDFDYSGTVSTDTPTQAGIYESQIAGVPSLASMVSTRWGYYCRSDHEAGPDNGDSNNAYTATNIAAAQAVFPFGTLGDTVNTPVHGLYQAWVVGRVRFIMIDIRNTDRSPGSNTDNSSKTMLGATQLSWLQGQLTQPEPLKVILSDVAWMGPASITNGPDKWWSYDTERQAIISYITANQAQVGNVMLWHGDSHLVGCTQGAANTWGAFSVLCAAPLLNTGGGLNTSTFTSFYNNAGGECRLYGRVAISDDGNAITVAYQGWDAASGTARVSQTDVFPTPTAGLNAAGSLNAGGGIAGAASLTGTGTVTASAVQAVTATLAAAGALSTVVTLRAPATLSGTAALGNLITQGSGGSLGGAGSLVTAVTLRSAATLAAAGSLAAGAVQQVPATLAAAGSLSGAVTQGAGTALGGAGTLTGTAGQGSSLGGAGSLNAPAAVLGITAALAGAGSLVTSAAQRVPATLAGAASLSAPAAQQVPATLAGTAQLNAPAVIQAVTATLAGTGSLGTAAVLGAGAVLGGAGSLTGTAGQGAALGGTGTLNAPASTLRAPAALSGTGSLAATAAEAAPATLPGTGTLTATAAQQAPAVLAGTGSLASAAAQQAPAVLAGTGTLAGAGTQLATAVLAGTGSLSTSGTGSGAASLAGTGSLAGTITQQPPAILAGTGSVNAPASLQQVPATLAGAGSLTAAAIQRAGATLAGTGSLAAFLSQAAVLGGQGSLSASGTAISSGVLAGTAQLNAPAAAGRVPAVLAGTAQLNAPATRQAAAASLTGAGSLDASAVSRPPVIKGYSTGWAVTPAATSAFAVSRPMAGSAAVAPGAASRPGVS